MQQVINVKILLDGKRLYSSGSERHVYIYILSDPTEPLSDRTAHSGFGLNLDIR